MVGADDTELRPSIDAAGCHRTVKITKFQIKKEAVAGTNSFLQTTPAPQPYGTLLSYLL